MKTEQQFVFNFLTHGNYCGKVLRLYSYYKPALIRYVKNISLILGTTLIIITVLLIARPAEKTNIKAPAKSAGSSDKKFQIDQAKKYTILRRFISYCDVKRIAQ